ncbi:Protein msta, isoform B [Habropoda laboriosa]|uniref:Protein msta, isoform B n=1 Tax=Habropoda laboriosa TaxID=597456 RepID=A0A0L7QW60_9HYME|nr:Protein msta, isoform B [Habropoda laboriosa]
MEGVCPICGQRATLRCGSCRQQFYCSKEHQKQDWHRHRSACQAWKICENSELGRHLLASRDLNPGDVVVSEMPLVWGPAMHTDQRVCVGCGKQCTNSRMLCLNCLWPACDSDCPGLTDKSIHGSECSLLIKAKIVSRCDVLLVIRMFLLWRNKSKQWKSLEKLQSHEDSRETAPPYGGAAIYEIACLLEHSCLPNTRHSFTIDDKGRPRITVTAVCFIPKGDHLSTMYTHALWTTRARRSHLLETKYFSCHCKRCTDPTELGTHLGTLKCPNDQGFILPKDPLDFESEWRCNSCPGVLTTPEVVQFIGKLEEDVDEVMRQSNMNKLADLLSRLTTLLHTDHQQCITVSHSLIQLLPGKDPRKPELCKRILQTTKTLDPYGVRLVLYTAVALRELSTCPGEDRRALLSEALSLMQYEPEDSPGGKLKVLMESEL